LENLTKGEICRYSTTTYLRSNQDIRRRQWIGVDPTDTDRYGNYSVGIGFARAPYQRRNSEKRILCKGNPNSGSGYQDSSRMVLRNRWEHRLQEMRKGAWSSSAKVGLLFCRFPLRRTLLTTGKSYLSCSLHCDICLLVVVRCQERRRSGAGEG
jgi:hypothetical protein